MHDESFHQTNALQRLTPPQMDKLKDRLARGVRSSTFASCAYYFSTDLWARLRFKTGYINTRSGTTHSSLPLQASLDYILEVFTDYKRYGEVTSFYGRIAELGPGDNCGVGLLFLADGSSSIDLIDRFYSERDSRAHAQIYRTLWDQHPSIAPFVEHADLNRENSFSGIQRQYGPEASAERFFCNHKGYDFIVSRAVLEHVYDPLIALTRMTDALNPRGMLLHKVDLRDHGLFSLRFHELKFLEIPDWLYPLMTRGSGRPNRILLHRYKQCMARLPLETKFLVTRLAGVGAIDPHLIYADIPADLRQRAIDYVQSVRHRFGDSLQDVSDEDVSVAGVFLVARKVGSVTSSAV